MTRWAKAEAESVASGGAGSAAVPGPDPAHADQAATADRTGRSRGLDALVPVLFMASGAAGLIYQVVWTQDLVLIFGDTTQAVVTTVTAFLAGLGIGALVGARVAARLRNALRVYGLLEIAVGGIALLMPLLFDIVATLFRSAYISLPSVEVELIRFALAFVAMIPVTMLMGMSLPVLTRHLVRTDPDIGERIARLYGLNTLGAVIGSVASGYFLIELIGLRATTFVAVALNLCAGGGAVLIARTLQRPRELNAGVPAAARRPRLRPRQYLVLCVTFVSGLVSLALEVLWTRIMLQDTGSSIYVFVAVVSVFLIGIAAGSLVYERQKDRAPQMATLGTLLATAALLAIVPLTVSNITGPSGLPIAVLLILPVTGILGFTFPLTVRLFVGSADQASRGVGLVYAVNTVGCVCGTVSAGFLFIPLIGTSAAIITLCIAQAALGGGLAFAYAPRKELLRPFIAVMAVGILGLSFLIPAARLTYVQRQISTTHLQTAHFDDPVASIDVTGSAIPHKRNLYINGVGITKLTIVTKLLAYIPKALRPNATTMLNICFGMGSTYRSSIIAGLHTTAVELDPTVPTVMHWFYSDASKYLHSPLGHVIISDGRNYVRLSNKRYDLITIDAPPPIWSAGAVVLLTREFYQEAIKRLEPGGVLTSFVPYGDESLLLRTFRASFRYVIVMKGLRYGMYMIGSQSPMQLRSSAIKQLFGSPAVRADLDSGPDYGPVPTAAWPGILDSLVWLRNNQVNRFVGTGPTLSDDHPLTEYFLLSSFSSFAHSRRGFERGAVETGLVVVCLLVLLGGWLTVEAVSRRRAARRTWRSLPDQQASETPAATQL
jgi:spermidine synthase